MFKNIKNEILNSKPFHLKNFCDKLFSWKELEQLLNLRPFISNERFVVINGLPEFNIPDRNWLTNKNSWPPNKIVEGITNRVCYLVDCSRVNKKINTFCGELELLTEKPVDAHIYFDYTNKKGHSFPIHWDYADNLIVQIEGKTNFKIWNFYTDNENIRLVKSLDKSPFIDVIMEPGDIIFVPAKMWHQAISETKRLSISFPIQINSTNKENIQEREWISLDNF